MSQETKASRFNNHTRITGAVLALAAGVALTACSGQPEADQLKVGQVIAADNDSSQHEFDNAQAAAVLIKDAVSKACKAVVEQTPTDQLVATPITFKDSKPPYAHSKRVGDFKYVQAETKSKAVGNADSCNGLIMVGAFGSQLERDNAINGVVTKKTDRTWMTEVEISASTKPNGAYFVYTDGVNPMMMPNSKQPKTTHHEINFANLAVGPTSPNVGVSDSELMAVQQAVDFANKISQPTA